MRWAKTRVWGMLGINFSDEGLREGWESAYSEVLECGRVPDAVVWIGGASEIIVVGRVTLPRRRETLINSGGESKMSEIRSFRR